MWNKSRRFRKHSFLVRQVKSANWQRHGQTLPVFGLRTENVWGQNWSLWLESKLKHLQQQQKSPFSGNKWITVGPLIWPHCSPHWRCFSGRTIIHTHTYGVVYRWWGGGGEELESNAFPLMSDASWVISSLTSVAESEPGCQGGTLKRCVKDA